MVSYNFLIMLSRRWPFVCFVKTKGHYWPKRERKKIGALLQSAMKAGIIEKGEVIF